jgi:glycosyltransferase involved in cell wall biosynthesis
MGGGATRSHNVAVGLVRAGCKVTVVSAAPHYPSGNIPERYRWKPLRIEYRNGMKIVRTFVPPMESKGYARRAFLFISFVLSSLFAIPTVGRVDVVFAANPNITATFAGLVYKTFNSCPLVQNVDDLWPEALYDLGVKRESFIGRFGELVAKLAYSIASAITPISPAYVHAIRSKCSISSDKIHVVKAGVNLSLFSQEQLGASRGKNAFRVLYIGAFSPAYNFDQVFKAAEILSSSPDIEFVIRGGGELAGFLKEMARNSNESNIRVVNRIVSRNEVARAMLDADALLLPLCGIGSIELGISSKLYEYQAMRKPIICVSRGQPGRYIAESDSGIVVEPGDFNALARAVLHLRNNESEARRLGANGRKHVELNLSIDRIGSDMKRIFEETIRSHEVT